jgi:EmrB/QacA subfamily drug resistance transporter
MTQEHSDLQPAPVPGLGVTRPWLALALLCIGQFMLSVDDTVVNVALPSIEKDFGFDHAGLVWVVNIYVLCFGGFLLLGGRTADLLGHKRVFLTSLFLFGAASVFTGAVTSSKLLVAARALQGLAAAFVAPSGLALVATSFQDPKERAKALGIWGGIGGIGLTVGVLLSGLLTSFFSWRWVFFINVPLTLVAFFGVLRVVKADKPIARGKFDFLGAVSITGGLVLLLFAMLQGERQGMVPSVTFSLIASVVLLVSFGFIQRRATHPLVPRDVLRRRTIGACVLAFLTPAAFFGMFFMLTLYLQQVLHYSPMRTGLAYLGFNAAVMIGMAMSGTLVVRHGVRTMLTIGMALSAVGLFWLSFLPVDGSYWRHVLPGMVILGVGGSWSFITVTIYAVSTVDESRSGVVSGLLQASQQLGGAVGLGVIVAVANYRSSQLSGSPETVQVGGFQAAFIVAAALSILGVILTRIMVPAHVKQPTGPGEAPALPGQPSATSAEQ